MKRGSFFLGKSFEIRNMEFGALGPRDVLIKNMAVGICGTDVHIFHGDKGSAEVTPPVVLGHEYSGIVMETGSDVTIVKPGDKVTVDPNIYCGLCDPCRMGKKQCCENLEAIGVTRNGGLAEYSVVPDTQCFKLNDDVDFDVAALAEPLACAIHGIDKLSIVHGESVAIIGGGPIGLIMLQLAKKAGASKVIVSEPVAGRRQLALQLGADHVVDPVSEDLVGMVRKYTGHIGTDTVIECVGKVAATHQAIAVAGHCGRVLLFSVPQTDAKADLPLYDVFKKELTVMGSLINPDTHQRSVNMINSHGIELKRLVTHTFPLSGVQDAISMQMSPESIKVVVHPQE